MSEKIFLKSKKQKNWKKKMKFFRYFHFSEGFSHFLWQKKFGGSFWRYIHITLRLKHTCYPPLLRPLILAASPTLKQFENLIFLNFEENHVLFKECYPLFLIYLLKNYLKNLNFSYSRINEIGDFYWIFIWCFCVCRVVLFSRFRLEKEF